jgi:galactokinase
VLIRKTNDGIIKFRSLNQDYTADVPVTQLQIPHAKEWVNYPLGVFDQYIKKGIAITQGMEMLFWGNVPNGAGLSSSAALEVATAFTINVTVSPAVITGFVGVKLLITIAIGVYLEFN